MPEDFQALSQDLVTVSRVNPRRRSPGVSVGIARSYDPLNDAEAVAGFSEALWLKKRLTELEHEGDQLAAWDRLNDGQKRLVQQAGYVPPHRRPEGRSWWKKILDPIAGAAEDVLAPFAWAGDKVLQAYRTAKIVERDNEAAGHSRWNPFSWSKLEWGRAWREAGDDMPDFAGDPAAILRERDLPFSEQDVPILVDAVKGMHEFDMYAKWGADRVSQVLASEDFDAAIAELKANQLSPGRVISYNLGIRPGQKFQVGPLKTEIELFDLYSGSLDALTRWYTDPMNRPMRALGLLSRSQKTLGGAYRAAKYGLQSAEDIRRVSQFAPVQRAYRRIADAYKSGFGGAQVAEEFKDLVPLLREMDKVKPSTPEAVQEFLEGEAGFAAILQGRAGKFYGVDLSAVRATPLKGAKETVKRGITAGFEATEGIPGLRRVGIGYRRFTNLVPKKSFIVASNANDQENVEYIRQVAKYVLPSRKVKDAVNAWIGADDVAGKKIVLTGLIDDVFNRLGAGENLALSRQKDRLLRGIKEDGVSGSYGAGVDGRSVSAVTRPGTKSAVHSGLFEHQMSPVWALPDFREMVHAMRSVKAWRNMPGMGAIPDHALDNFMDRIWKPIVLFRLGFPIRAAGEETARLILEDGFLPAFKSRMAASAVRNWEKSQTLPLLKAAGNPKGFGPSEMNIVKWTGQRVHALLGNVEGALAGEKYLNAAMRLYGRFGPNMLPSGISALKDAGGSWTDRPESIERWLRDQETGMLRRVRLRPGRSFKGYRPEEDLFPQMWAAELGRHMESPSFKIAVEHLDDPEAAKAAVLAYLKSDEAVKFRSRAYRAKQTAGGKTVGVEVAEDDALRDWADKIVEATRGLTHTPEGEAIPEVLKLLRAGRVPAIDDLARVKSKPLVVSGREMVEISAAGRWWEDLTHKGFGFLERQINWLSRQPIFVHEYAKALDDVGAASARVAASLGAKTKTKIVDEVGAPARVYHGTKQVFDDFDPALAGSGHDLGIETSRVGQGLYFTQDPDYASFVSGVSTSTGLWGDGIATGEVLREGFASEKEASRFLAALPERSRAFYTVEPFGKEAGKQLWAVRLTGSVKGSPNVRVAYLDMRNPAVMRDRHGMFSPEEIDELRAKGHDGVIFTEGSFDGAESYLVFSPDQVKTSPSELMSKPPVNMDSWVEEQALELAGERTIGLIDQKDVRSQFALANKNLFPFWHAQEQFLKRWAKAIVRDPSLVRRAQLTMMGLRHSGVLHADEEGDYFYFPAPMFMMGVLQKAAPLLGGKQLEVPIPIGLTGRVKFMQAGIESPRAALIPSAGPVGRFALGVAKKYFPEWTATTETKLDGEEDERPLWEQVVPSTIVGAFKLFEGTFDKDARDSKIAGWQIKAAQYLEANGHGLPEDASPGEREEYQDRVRHWAVTLGALQIALGFAAPVKPQPQFLGDLSEEFSNFLASHESFDEAMNAFIAKNPDATAYTVFRTKAAAKGAPLPATEVVANFLKENPGLVKKYGPAATWLFPQQDGAFSRRAYELELANELRVRKTPKEVWEEIKIRSASDIYYAERDDFRAKLDAERNPERRKSMRAAFDAWQEEFFELHPIFEAHVRRGAERQFERAGQLDQIRLMLADESRPKVKHEGEMLRVVENWDDYSAKVALLGRSDVDERRKERLTRGFRAWGRSLSDDTARQMFRSLIEPLISGDV